MAALPPLQLDDLRLRELGELARPPDLPANHSQQPRASPPRASPRLPCRALERSPSVPPSAQVRPTKHTARVPRGRQTRGAWYIGRPRPSPPSPDRSGSLQARPGRALGGAATVVTPCREPVGDRRVRVKVGRHVPAEVSGAAEYIPFGVGMLAGVCGGRQIASLSVTKVSQNDKYCNWGHAFNRPAVMRERGQGWSFVPGCRVVSRWDSKLRYVLAVSKHRNLAM